MKIFSFFFLAFAFFTSCKKYQDVQPFDEIDQLMTIPSHFPMPPKVDFNPSNKQAIVLGRKLFFDVNLSANNRISCASCHLPQKAFTDGVALSSIGFSGNKLHRNSMPLFNLAWATSGLFWDGGATNLESLSIGPLTHPDEMAENVLTLPSELAQNPDYVKLFAEAYPEEDGAITIQKVLKALAQYMRVLISANSKYDLAIRNPSNRILNELEIKGLKVFDQKCNSCHNRSQHLFKDNDFHNNGLDDTFSTDHELVAMGRFRITFKQEDIGKFKTPSLRNLSFTAPYMHDGRFATLQDVLNHYSSGIKASPTLAPQLRNFTLSEDEKQALLAFLKTLDDDNFVKNPLYKPEHLR
jgi:cytochrome c peroxidase